MSVVPSILVSYIGITAFCSSHACHSFNKRGFSCAPFYKINIKRPFYWGRGLSLRFFISVQHHPVIALLIRLTDALTRAAPLCRWGWANDPRPCRRWRTGCNNLSDMEAKEVFHALLGEDLAETELAVVPKKFKLKPRQRGVNWREGQRRACARVVGKNRSKLSIACSDVVRETGLEPAWV